MREMDGQRVEKKPGDGGKKKKICIIAGAAAGLLLCAYLGLCAWVGSMDTIYPNVSVLGVDVSGMTLSQAQTAVEEALEQNGENIQLSLAYQYQNYTLSLADMGLDAADNARAAWQEGRGNFFLRGGSYLAHLAGMSRQAEPAWSADEPQALADLVRQVEEEIGNVTQASYAIEGDQLTMTKGRSGASVDKGQLVATVQEGFEEVIAQWESQGAEGLIASRKELPVVETPPQEPDFDAIYEELAAEPENAVMDPETFAVTDHVVGVDFDVQALKTAYEQAGEGETFSIPVTLTQPKDTKESLEGKLFRDVLGEGSTVLTGTANRQFNVKLAAEACNGAVIMPGEVFSFNGRTGSRSAAMGYKSATVYSGGKTVEEVGGGVCQTSSTIYYALLHSALEVVDRINHGYNTGYVPVGMDATVYYGVTDFQFRNNTEYPIKIYIASERQGSKELLVCRIYGTNEEGIYAIPESTSYDWQYPTTVYQADESIPRGTTKVDTVQNPYTGLKAHTYRSIYDKEGNLIEKQDLGVSVYRMRPKTILYNPADGDPSTWVNGVPPQPGAATDPGTSTDPGTATDPGTSTDPGTATDPGTTTDPVDPGTGDVPDGGDPVDPGTGGGSGQAGGGGTSVPDDSTPSQDIQA